MSDTRSSSSIAQRLTVINMLVSGVALILAGVAFATYDRTTFRQNAQRTLSIHAQIFGSNSVAPLMFNDPEAAAATLSALSASPNIVSAAISSVDGRTFAVYRRTPESPAPERPIIAADGVEAHILGADQISVARRIVFQGKELGTVTIRSSIDELNARRNQYLTTGTGVLFAALIAAYMVSAFSRRFIAAPIQDLAAVARHVTREKDYTIRADPVTHTREIDVLVGAFNDMLAEIQRRDLSLREAHEQLETRVRERTAELDTVNKELEAFSYSVSHDLRAPLRHITGFAGLLEQRARAKLDDQDRDYLGRVVHSARRMGRLIDDLLEFSRMSRTDIVKRRVSLNDLVRQAKQETDMSSTGPTVEWRVHDLPDVEGDQGLLYQVIVNLLSNAVKYSSVRERPCVEVGTSDGAPNELVIFVRDNGVGFDMAYAHKLFGVFQRLHGNDEFEGTGIGLANVRRIIHRHGGRVWAEAALDQGATFYVAIPRAPSTA